MSMQHDSARCPGYAPAHRWLGASAQPHGIRYDTGTTMPLPAVPAANAIPQIDYPKTQTCGYPSDRVTSSGYFQYCE